MLCSQLHIRVFGTCFFNLNMYVNVGMVKPAWGRCVDNSVENLTETGFPRCKENLLRPSLLTHLNGGIMNLGGHDALTQGGGGGCMYAGSGVQKKFGGCGSFKGLVTRFRPTKVSVLPPPPYLSTRLG
jgi:hypothetical protein